MVYRVKTFPFFCLLLSAFWLLFNPLILKAQDESQTTTSTAVTSPQPVQEIPPIIHELNAFEKEFAWDCNQTRGLVRSAILLAPSAFQELAIYEFRKSFSQKVSKGTKYITYVDVIEALDAMVPDKKHLEFDKKLLGIPPYTPEATRYQTNFFNSQKPSTQESLSSQQNPIQMTPEEIKRLNEMRKREFLEE